MDSVWKLTVWGSSKDGSRKIRKIEKVKRYGSKRGGSGGSIGSDAVVGVPLDRADQCGHFGVKYMDSGWKLTVWV
jgi:hypothetical protein